MAELKNCKLCGKVYTIGGFTQVCPQCKEQDEFDFDKIREYLYIHPGAKIFEVVSDLRLGVNKIKRYLREGRLEVVEENNVFLQCEMCGDPIHSGKYCEKCLHKSHHDYDVVYTSKPVFSQKTRLSYSSSVQR
jgi:uncharacterized protein